MGEWVLWLVLLGCVAQIGKSCYSIGRAEGWRECRAYHAELERLANGEER